MSVDTLAAAKRALRREALGRRAAAHRTLAGPAADAVRRHLLSLELPDAAGVAGYWPIRDELDPRPALAALAERGVVLALPVVVARGSGLIFRRWRPGDPLQPDALGLAAPGSDAAPMTPAIVLVPLVAFDRQGGRLGYGAGFYDRTLAALRAQGAILALGLAYAAQEVPAVPVAGEDQRLDGVITERDVLWYRGGGTVLPPGRVSGR